MPNKNTLLKSSPWRKYLKGSLLLEKFEDKWCQSRRAGGVSSPGWGEPMVWQGNANLCHKVPVSEHGRDFPVQGVCVHLGAHCESRAACTVRGNACASESHKRYCSFPWKLGSDSLGGFRILRLMEQHFTVSASLCVQRPGCLVLYKLPSKKLISSFWVWDNTLYTNKKLLPQYFHNYWDILAKWNIYSDKTGTLNVLSLLIGWKNFWPCSERFSGKNQS